jgi:hypothetical protein
MDERTRQAVDRKASADSEVSAGQVAKIFAHSMAYSALQTPIDGVTQLANAIAKPFAGPQAVPRVELISQPQQTEFGSTEWTARLAGGGIGTILPFWLGGKLAVRGAEAASHLKVVGPLIERSGVLKANSIAQLAYKGAVYEGIFHPVNESADNFWTQRSINFASGGLSFMAMGYANQGMRNSWLGHKALNSNFKGVPLVTDLGMDAVSGATAGVSDTLIRTTLSGQMVTSQQIAESAGEYALLSMFLRLGRMPIEKAAGEKPPTAGEPRPVQETKTKGPDLENLNLRPTLPYDKTISFDQLPKPEKHSFAGRTESVPEIIGIDRKTGKSLVYREKADAPDAPRKSMTIEEFEGSNFQSIRHKDQHFVLDRQGRAYSVQQINGRYELVLTDKLILERLNEVQVPWPPLQSNEQYRSRDVIKLNELLVGWMKNH